MRAPLMTAVSLSNVRFSDFCRRDCDVLSVYRSFCAIRNHMASVVGIHAQPTQCAASFGLAHCPPELCGRLGSYLFD